MSKDFQKQVIEFNEIAFNEAELKYKTFIQIENDIIVEASKYISKFNDAELLNGGLPAFYKLIKDKYQNEIKLDVTGEKICFLIDLNTSHLKELFDKYQNKVIAEPTIEAFTIYTNSEIENERLKVAKKVVVMLNELHEFTELKSLLVQRGLNNSVMFDNHTQMYIPNWYFIKTTL